MFVCPGIIGLLIVAAVWPDDAPGGAVPVAELSANSVPTPMPAVVEPEWWRRVPRPQPFPPSGNFFTPSRSPGYYSIRDALTGTIRDGVPKNPFSNISPQPLPFFELDFRLVDPPGDDRTFPWLDEIKRIPLGEHWLLATGGEYRFRFNNEGNARLTTIDNNYYLTRLRTYTDLWYEDKFRMYLEFISADIVHNDLPPVLPDRDPADFLNAFLEFKLGEFDGHAAAVRLGRQEILLGSQRVIGTLEWANTRRTFDGVRGYWRGDDYDFDLFWLQPVIPNGNGLNSPDGNVNVAGAWWSFRPEKDVWADVYALFANNGNVRTSQGIPVAPGSLVTLGSRHAGRHEGWQWDAEVMLQLGALQGNGLVAGATTVGAGRYWSNLPLTPSYWIYYDMATGTQNPGEAPNSTYQQLFPFSHYYLGWTDQVGRENIRDFNQHLYVYPAPWMTCWVQYHRFWLFSARDALYNAAGQVSRVSRNGSAGYDVGQEVDLIVNFHIGPRSDILTGYCYLFGGDFLRQTGPAANSSLTFVQYQFRW